MSSSEVEDRDWLLVSISTGAVASLRVHVWRQLRKLGAIYIQQSICLLPDRPPITKAVTRLLARVRAQGGQARCLHVRLTDTDEIVAGHRELIRVVGGTIMPFKGNPWLYPEGTPEPFALEQIRDEVNTWIRTSGEYDAVADFEQALRSPTDPDQLRPEFNVRDGQEGDWLHPNDAGLNAMAEAIDLSRL
ncbi:Chromate resistance protein ChrB [Nonomuraea sp. bgisy101]|uniref:Chromate resistance protein ChrB n=1 Tax=Nonomuraea sp. bgisy101 TaxID=3413784 RepID=UPI003D728C2B